MLEYSGLDLRLSQRSRIGKREEEAIVVYDKLKCWARTVLKDKIGKDAVWLFDEHCEDGFAKRIPAMKKLDWLLWGER